MNKKFLVIALLIVAAGSLAGGIFGRIPVSFSADSNSTTGSIEANYSEALKIIDENYSGKIDHEKILEDSVQGMLWTLDPHSSFFSRDEFRKLNEDQSSQFYGIGVSILQHRDGVYVQSIVPNTPADKAGLRYGDRFVEVDGKDAKDWTSAELSKNVRGERGTTVKVEIERVGADKPLEFEIQRGGVPLPSIRNSFMLPNNVGYVGFTGGFQDTSAEELDEAVATLKKQGMKSLILDLRGNPGGVLGQAIEVVSRFIPKGKTVVSVKGRTNYVQAQNLLTVGGDYGDLPLVVMINGGSASASEIVSGAIQDYDRGIIVGSDSFGKGLVQRVYPLPYGAGLTLTTARYYTPFGRSLQRDYSNGSIYDYYTHQAEGGSDAENAVAAPKPAGSPVTAANGRVLYGGRGIEPDVKTPALTFSPLRGRLGEATFFFVRQLVAGKIANFENFKVDKQNFDPAIQPNDFQVGDKLLEAFKSFAAADKKFGLTAANIGSEADYAKMRIRDELATANYSNEAGIQVLLEKDPQILKAIDVMPDAKKLLENK